MEINKLIDSLKIEDLKNLNKKRGLSTSGNRSILIDILKKYEKAEYVKISPVVSQKYLNKTNYGRAPNSHPMQLIFTQATCP